MKDQEFLKALQAQFNQEAEAKNMAWKETKSQLENMKANIEHGCELLTNQLALGTTKRVMARLTEKLHQKQKELEDVLLDNEKLGESDDPEKIVFRKNMAGVPK